MALNKSPIPPPIKHKGHTQTMERGSWGPHTAKIVCISCGGEFVKWASTKSDLKNGRI